MKFIRIGRLIGGHGLEGELKVKLLTDNPELFDSIEYLMLAKDDSLVRSYVIEQVRDHRGMLLVFVDGVETLEEAEALKGLDVVVPEEMLPEEEDGEVYWFKIENSRVVTETGEEIGKLVDYMEAGGTEVFRILLDKGGHAMISNNPRHVEKIDADARVIRIHSDGLVYEEDV